ncbi:Biotin carboxyl carrier protein of acetyl-CoA carboxylase [Hartmannibacter diazotrophicus]|uniref:Biotin carboxyl carrier protein of acetyl-CoA carboxylase n=1 Tax=Hartmannibacter diazotrophicus TaxID=1482074 RepID=A0A2C9D6P9_9HYPH|nr:acetyl-CoA carboxylase biotin carboxyl carrier protein [Hartmannibacter diazotrophicus]SON55421.1 Biotin carboxyl carrier protein of acetyl-CoA carboxylase [Hartmannibacter diazotrophicus]
MAKTNIDQTAIRQLAKILKETDLSEIEVEQEGLRIRVARTVIATAQVASPAPVAMVSPPPPAAVAPAPAPAAASDPASNPGAVTSPMVGTCYLAPEPGARTFVTVGDTVRAGQTLLIIEAMKHMNQIPAPRAGKVTAILIDDGQPVEYGEVLVVIE